MKASKVVSALLEHRLHGEHEPTVSVDVSTGADDAFLRAFGTSFEVQETEHDITLLEERTLNRGDRPAKLSRARSSENRWDGLCQDLQIQPEGPLVHIAEIQEHPLIEGNCAAAIHLPEAGDARFYTEPPALPILVETLVIPHWQRSGTDQTHVAPQNVN